MRRESWKKVVREKKGSAPAAVVVVAKETSTLLCVNKKTMATQFRQLNLQVKITKKREKFNESFSLYLFPLCSFMGFQTPITEVDRPNNIFHFCTFLALFPPFATSAPFLQTQTPKTTSRLPRRRRSLGRIEIKEERNGGKGKGGEGKGRERNRGRSNGQRGQEKKSSRVSRIGSNERSKKGE